MVRLGLRHRNGPRGERILCLPDAYFVGFRRARSERPCGAPIGSRHPKWYAMPRTNKPSRYADLLTVLFPNTRTSIPTKIATDVRTLAKAWHSKVTVSCPHCGEVHTYRVCEAFVEAAISQARLRGEHTMISDHNPIRHYA
jgi:hypothetical protein